MKTDSREEGKRKMWEKMLAILTSCLTSGGLESSQDEAPGCSSQTEASILAWQLTVLLTRQVI